VNFEAWWWLALIPVSFILCVIAMWPRGQSEYAPLRRERRDVHIVGVSGVAVVNNKVTFENGGRVSVDGVVVHDSTQPSSVDLSSWVGADSVTVDCSSGDSGACASDGGACGDGGGGGCD
jgi:hypothetical protein